MNVNGKCLPVTLAGLDVGRVRSYATDIVPGREG
jgi:hypothetical protein